ncbi:efflux RND transporter permease subunit [Candidatus Avelusimicrobium gallicola]|uniref:Hydrophobe/amphiphile efflux-1 family RND transporter n=1 Tax=Candidatus Avelusimicrobium gallicola TaxID=2562704 RepID=A0A1Y4DKQ3_9BACT|nr:multidrug efflux RND transporter permease subunit [Elusimicrobium sp. An273]OUO57508.1 hydrophobe/amphiphile efflux-1 family RND transporter [Elusimicrobium sp. An273]
MFSKFFINRPIFSTVISLLISLAGIVSITMLPIEQYPDLTPPTIEVSASYPGASPEVIANTVAAPIEQQVNGVEDMLYMNSTSSSNGDMSLVVSFKVGTDPDQAMINVNNRVQGATATLPEDVRRYGVEVNKKSSAILQLIALYSPNGHSDTTTIGNYALLNIVDDLKRIEGVGDAQVMSANDYSIRIWIKPDVLSQRGLSVSDIVAAVQAQNTQRSAGKIGQPPLPVEVDRMYSIVAPGRLTDPKEFEEIILRANPDGTSLRLKDVARVELGSQTYEFNGRFNGKPAVPVGVYLSPGANAVATAKAVDEHMKEIAQNFPPDLDIDYKVAYDTTLFVTASIEEVIHTLIEAMILVFLVVYLFLKDWRATLIPCLAVPVSIIGAFAGMLLLGFSINTLTLFGLVLAIGIVVDDAIVVIENVERIMHEENLPVKEATIKAMGEVSGPVVAIVLVLCSVFVPVAFMGGLTGIMYQQFAITIAVSVVISGLVALTLTPALCALLLRKQPHPTRGFFYQFDRFFEKLTAKYGTWVAFFIRKLTVSVVLIAVLFLGAFGLFKIVPGSLLPDEDQGVIMVAAQLDPSASLSNSDEVAVQLENLIMAQPAVSEVLTFSGYDILSSTQKSNTVAAFVMLKPWKERKEKSLSSAALVGSLYAQAQTKIPNAVVMPFNPPPIMGMSTTGGLEGYIQNRSSGGSDALEAQTQKFIEAAKKRPELSSVSTTFSAAIPQYKLDVDEIKAQAMGVPLSELYATLQGTFGTYYINDFTYSGRSFKVMMQADGQYRARPEQISGIYVRSNSGAMVPLSTLVTLTPTLGPDVVERFNVFPAAKIMATPAAGYSSGDAIRAVEETAKEVLDSGFTLAWTGTTYQEKISGNASAVALLLGMLVVFLILAAQYEKWSLPIAVLLAVPFAIFGALAGTWARGLSNDIYFQIALVALVGLAAKNAILIVEFAVMLKAQGYDTTRAAVEAAKLRFRPIVMTSLAFILGCVPLAVSTGAGAASRHAIGTAVVFGMLAATLIAPLFVPMFFTLLSGGRTKQLAQAVETSETKKENV